MLDVSDASHVVESGRSRGSAAPETNIRRTSFTETTYCVLNGSVVKNK